MISRFLECSLSLRKEPHCITFLILDYLVEFSGQERLTSGGNGTAGIWSTYPPDFVSNWTGFADQVSTYSKNS